MTRPAKKHRPRGDAARQAAFAIRLLAINPHRPVDLMKKLGVSRRSVERMLRGIESAGWKVESERRGQAVWYFISEAGFDDLDSNP